MRKRYLQLCLAAGMAFVANEASRSWLAPHPGAGAPRRIFTTPERFSGRIGLPRAAGGDGVTSTLTKTSTLIKKAFLCSAFVVLSAIGPILFDWVKRHNAGRFPFFVPALVFHAWAIDGLIGLGWAAAQGRKGLKLLWRPDMLWRFFITTSLFVAGDMLSFMSIAHLDVGTFSLVGKALAIILTVLLSRVVLKKGQSPQQYALVVAVAVATVVFCQSEAHARQMASQRLGCRVACAGFMLFCFTKLKAAGVWKKRIFSMANLWHSEVITSDVQGIFGCLSFSPANLLANCTAKFVLETQVSLIIGCSRCMFGHFFSPLGRIAYGDFNICSF
eukprot:s204_g22.t1